MLEEIVIDKIYQEKNTAIFLRANLTIDLVQAS
jgi:hypothetical protein